MIEAPGNVDVLVSSSIGRIVPVAVIRPYKVRIGNGHAKIERLDLMPPAEGHKQNFTGVALMKGFNLGVLM
jgi:hypothetical protein